MLRHDRRVSLNTSRVKIYAYDVRMTANRHWIRAIGYALIACGGISAMIWPSVAATGPTTLTHGPVIFLWALLLAVGGVTSAIGSAADIWLGEYAGLWPIIVTFMLYGFANAVSGNLVQLALSLIILGWSFLLLFRWREVALVRSEALRFNRYRQRAGGTT